MTRPKPRKKRSLCLLFKRTNRFHHRVHADAKNKKNKLEMWVPLSACVQVYQKPQDKKLSPMGAGTYQPGACASIFEVCCVRAIEHPGNKAARARKYKVPQAGAPATAAASAKHASHQNQRRENAFWMCNWSPANYRRCSQTYVRKMAKNTWWREAGGHGRSLCQAWPTAAHGVEPAFPAGQASRPGATEYVCRVLKSEKISFSVARGKNRGCMRIYF